MKHRYWIFDMDGTLTDSMPIWAEVPYELVRGFGRTPAPDLGRVLLPMSALETAQYLITTYDLPLTIDSYTRAAMDAVDRLYRGVRLKPGGREGAAGCGGGGGRVRGRGAATGWVVGRWCCGS